MSLRSIVDKFAEVNDHVGVIVDAVRNQARGLDEVNTGVGTLDRSIQRNAAMVEESAAACAELSGEVGSLNAMIGRFELAKRAAAPAGARRSTPCTPGSPAAFEAGGQSTGRSIVQRTPRGPIS